MHNEIVLRTQEALDALSNGIVQIYDVLAVYGEEVYNAVLSLV